MVHGVLGSFDIVDYSVITSSGVYDDKLWKEEP